MKTIAEINASRVLLVIIDPELNNMRNVVLFAEKVEKAKQVITWLNLPSKSK